MNGLAGRFFVCVSVMVAGVPSCRGPDAGSAPQHESAVATAKTSPVRASSPRRSAGTVDPAVVKFVGGGKAFVISRSATGRPPGDALAYVKSLEAKSRAGDATATFEAFLAVHECRSAMDPGSMRVLSAMRKAGAERAYLDSMDKRLKECESLLSDQAITDGKWLETAAKQGSVEAMLLYAASPETVLGNQTNYLKNPQAVADWKMNSMGYLQSAAGMGSVDAMLALGKAFSAGVLVEKDPVMGLAYYQAAGRMYPNELSTALIRSSQNDLTAAQQQSARRSAEEIIRNCCTKL